MASRKDNKGRVLRTGESQRKDGGYDFRYYDAKKKRHSVYAPTLNELRKKEAEIAALYSQGTKYAEGSTTVLDLVKRYLETKTGLSYNTQCSYNRVFNRVKESPIANVYIRDLKTSEVKRWFTTLSKNGLSYWTIHQTKGVLSPAFDLAVEDEILTKNPFDFSLSKVVPVDSKPRHALTYHQQRDLLKAFKNHPTLAPRYDLMVILLGTGMRISEAVGLTMNDIDMEKRTININHQLIYHYQRGLYISPPKSTSGYRLIPMSDAVYKAFQSVLEDRIFVTDEAEVDGLNGFVFLTKRGTPDYASLIQTALVNVVKDYNRSSPDEPLPRITPHILRHTFCTNMINSGVSVKQVQYLMGHSTATVTMNVYAHAMQEKSDDALISAMNGISLRYA